MKDVAVLDSTAGYGERATCSLCGKRRMCKFICILGTPGVGWMVCREHGDWKPTEGADYVIGDDNG